MDVEAKIEEEEVAVGQPLPWRGRGKHFAGHRQCQRLKPERPDGWTGETSTIQSIDGQFNPQRAFPGSCGVTTVNWFEAAFRIDRIGCP
jgi:hypothetical protein